MESLLLACQAVVPLLIYMLVGFFARKIKIFTADRFRDLNKLVFRIFLPLKLFFDVYKSDIHASLDPKLILFSVTSVLVIFAAAWVVFTKALKEKPDQGTVIQATYRSNFVLFGSLLASQMGGDSAAGLAAALAALVVPLFNALAVILFEVKRGGNIKPLQIILNIFKNPLIDASILGILFCLFGIPIPDLIKTPFGKLGDLASPVALVALGGMLSFKSIRAHRKLLILTSVLRLLAVPAIGLSLAVLLGLRGDALIVLIALFASPAAVSSGVMAQLMGGNGDLANEIVAATSALCIPTIFVFVLLLSRFGFL